MSDFQKRLNASSFEQLFGASKEKPKQSGHDYLEQIVDADPELHCDVAKVAIAAYKEHGRGAVIWIYDDLFEGWPRLCGNPGCTALHDALDWPQALPDLEAGLLFYAMQASFDPTCHFERQLIQLIKAYQPKTHFVLAVLDRSQKKGAFGIFSIPKSLRKAAKKVKGFG